LIPKKNDYKCDLCNSSKFRILVDIKGDVMTSDRKIVNSELKKVECIKCGLISGIIPHDRSVVKQNYERKYSYNLSYKGDTYFFTHSGFQDRSSYVFDWILTLLTKKELNRINTIVEVGCGQGNLLVKFAQKFPEKKIIGLEVNDEAIRIGRNRGLDIRKFNENTDVRADLVISFAVIEHTTSPRKFLETLNNFLSPGGLIVVGQPHQNKVYYDIFFLDHLYHFTTKHMKYLGSIVNLVEVRKSIGPWPIDSFSMHIFKKATRKLRPKIRFTKTKISDSLKYYNTIFRKVNRFLKESRNDNLAVFGLGEVFSLLYAYTNLRKVKIKYGIDDFPKKGHELGFRVITSDKIPGNDIERMLICVNPYYYKIIEKKVDEDRYKILFPFRIKSNHRLALRNR
jgi:SAM-dependent methyltransferase